MSKVIKIKLSANVTAEGSGVVFSDEKKTYINPDFISQLHFNRSNIYIVLGTANGGDVLNLHFAEAGMDEFRRIKRELTSCLKSA